MSALALKLRGPAIAVVVLLFSAGLALAGGGLTFPEAGSNPTADEGDGTDNHGDLVSDAAQMETPDGFKNHGAFVSCVAKLTYGKKGSEAPADFKLADLTPEDCAKADKDEAKADKDEAKAKAKADKAREKAERKKNKGHGQER